MKSSPVKIMLRSLLISYLLSLLLLFILTFLCFKLRLPENQITLTVYIVYVVSCLAGGFAAGKSIRQRRFFWGMLSGMLYFAVLFAVSWLSARDSMGNFQQIATIMAMCAATGTLGGMLS